MEKEKFKKIVAETLTFAGFKKEGTLFFKRTSEAIASIHLQRSSYSNGYYVSFGFFICAFDPTNESPKETECHIRSRFDCIDSSKETDFFDLEQLQEVSLRECLQTCIEREIPRELTIQGLREHLKQNPVLLYQTTQKAKQYLEICA